MDPPPAHKALSSGEPTQTLASIIDQPLTAKEASPTIEPTSPEWVVDPLLVDEVLVAKAPIASPS